MAACTLVGPAKLVDVPGLGKVYMGCASMPTTDTSGTLAVPKGAIINSQLTGTVTDEGFFMDAAPTAALGSQTPTITPTAGATLGSDYVTIKRTGSTSASKFFFFFVYG